MQHCPSETTAAALADEIAKRREARLAAEIVNWPRRGVIASDVPVCARQGVYAITHWEQRKLHDTHLQARFDAGKQEESQLVRELMEMGFEIVEQQVPLSTEMTQRYGLSGKIDGKIRWNGRAILFEVKSCHPAYFEKLRTLEDIKTDGFASRYYRQMQVYLLGHNEPDGLFIFTDLLGHWRIIPVPLDYEDAEAILSQVERINAHVKAGTLPDRIPYDDDICGRCPFAHICLPDVLQKSRVEFADDVELAKTIARHEELKPIAAEYEKLHETLRDYFARKRLPLIVVGDYIVAGKETSGRSSLRPAEQWEARDRAIYEALQKKYAVKNPGWSWNVKRAETATPSVESDPAIQPDVVAVHSQRG